MKNKLLKQYKKLEKKFDKMFDKGKLEEFIWYPCLKITDKKGNTLKIIYKENKNE